MGPSGSITRQPRSGSTPSAVAVARAKLVYWSSLGRATAARDDHRTMDDDEIAAVAAALLRP